MKLELRSVHQTSAAVGARFPATWFCHAAAEKAKPADSDGNDVMESLVLCFYLKPQVPGTADPCSVSTHVDGFSPLPVFIGCCSFGPHLAVLRRHSWMLRNHVAIWDVGD